MAVDPRVLKTIQDETLTAANPLPTARAIAPDAAGRAVKAHRQTGVDDLLYAENLQQLNDLDDQDKWDRIVATSPRTARFLAEKQTNAAMGRDDVDNLKASESLFPSFNRTMPAGYESYAQDPRNTYRPADTAAPFPTVPSEPLPSSVLSRSVRSLGRFVADVPAAFNYSVGLAAETVAPLTDWFPVANPLRIVAQEYKSLAKQGRKTAEAIQGELPKDAGVIERNWYGAVRSTGQQLPFMAATLATRNPSYALAGAGVMAGAESGMDAEAKGATTAQQVKLFAGNALAEAAFESMPLTKLLGDVKAGTSFGKMLFGQVVRELPSELATTVTQNFNEFATMRAGEPIANYIAELPADLRDTAISTVMQTFLVSGAGRGVSLMQQKADKAEAASVLIESLDKLSQASKVRNLDTTTYENFIADVSSGTPAENLYIDGKVLNQSGIALELARFAPELADDIQVAIESGGTLRIPTSTFAGRISGTDISQTVLENARTDPLGFSKVEAQDFYANQAEIMQGEIQRAANMQAATDEFAAGQKQVQDTIKAQLNSVGRFTPEANELYSLLIGSRVATRARQLGISPEQMFAESPLGVIGQMPAGVKDTALNQQFTIDDLLSSFDPDMVEELDATVPVMTDAEIDKNETRFLSSFPEAKRYTRKTRLLKRLRIASEAATNELDGSAEAERSNVGKLGPFSEVKTRAYVTEPDDFDPSGKLIVEVFGKEQVDEGLADEPALTFTVSADGELTVNGPDPQSKTFQEFQSRGWADFAAGYNSEQKSGWSAIKSKDGDLSIDEIGPLVADVHARVREWRNQDYVGLHWTRATGATGGMPGALGGRETAAFFQSDVIPATITIDGKERSTTNSNGQQIAQTEEGVRNFWRWFGDSKVVDGQGRPLVVYHGSPDLRFLQEDGEFKSEKGRYGFGKDSHAHWFTDSARTAKTYADPRRAFDYQRAEEGVIEAYIRIENPLTVNAAGEAWRTAQKRGQTTNVIDEATQAGNDGAIIRNVRDDYQTNIVKGDTPATTYTVFSPEQIKSATNNSGQFDPADANILNQDSTSSKRGAFIPDQNIIALLENADLSTFLHEAAHWFYETDIAMASKFVQQETRTAGEQEIVDDVSTLLNWHGIIGTPQQQLDQWYSMSFEEQRSMHERTAETFEAYLYTGKAPTIELQKAFNTFRQWLLNVYRSLKDFLASRNREMTDEVRGVFDRMLATQEQIDMANAARSMVNLIETADQVGMSQDEYKAYQELGAQATAEAASELEARSLRDMQYQANARSKEIKKLKAEQKELRDEITMQVRGEVMSMPIYRAWSFLTGRIREQDQIPKDEKSPRDSVDPKQDSLFAAIAKLGGLNRDEVKSEWGITDKIATTVFGKPVLRKSAGRALDEMARALGELGYLSQDRNGKTDVRELEEKFMSEKSGDPQYSVLYVVPEDARHVDDMGGGRFGEGELLSMSLPAGDVRLAVERKMVSKAGFNPDFIAELFGYDSGAQLISELADVDAPAYAIEKIVDARMLMNHGDLATDEAIEEAADKAIMNKVRARHVITEHNALAKATGGARILEKAAAELADKIIAAKKVRDIQPKEFTAAAAKAAVSAKKAMNSGDLKQAAEDSRARVIQTVTARAAFDAKDEIEAIDAFFKKVLAGRSDKLAKTRDMDIVNAARALLSEFGYGRKGQDPQGYLEIMKRQDPVTYDAVIGSVVAARALDVDSIQDLTLDQLRQVHEEVQSLWFLSKRSRQMEIEGDKMDRADVEDALVARLEEIGPITSEAGKESAITEKEVMALNMGSVKSALTRVENWVSMLDGNNKFGPFRRYFYQPIKDAADKYREAKGNTLKSFRGLFDQIMPDMKKGLIKADELGYTFGKDSGGVAMNEILHAILHTGNESNKRKMLLGRGWAEELPDGTLDTRRWDAFIARMIRENVIRKEHFDFAQGVWDLLEGTKVKAQEAHRNAYGKYFDEVSADEFTTPFGTYRGGYVPAKIDSRIVLDNELRDLVDAGKEGMAYAFPSTTKGFTKSRVEYNKPLMLDLRLLSQHIDSVLLFSYMENPIRDAAKVMSRGKVNMALNAQQPGMISGAIIPFLNRAGRQQVTTPVVGASWVMRKLNQMRANTGMAAMFANVSNAMQQVSGFALASTKVKPALIVSAAADYLAHPTKLPSEVAELSVFMRNRMSNETSAMMGEVEQILLDPNLYEKTQDWFKRHGYFMQSAVDNVMGPIIWKAAFTQYQEEGFSVDDSVRLADAVIRTTQGSTLPEDVSRMETGPAYARLLTQFAGYFNMQANLLGEEFGKVAQNGGLRKNMGRGFYLLIAAFLAPAMVAEAISQAFRGGPGDEDKDGEYLDDWLMATLVYGPLRNATAFVPFVGQAINSAVARFNGNPTDDKVSVAPVVGAIEGVAGVPFDLYREAIDKGNSNRTIKDVATLISITTGIPVTAAAKPIRYLVGQEEGKIQPVSAADAARGLITGVASPESRGR